MTNYLNPYTKSRRWVRGNLHAHTNCGRYMAATESATIYAMLGYDFLAITDHNQAPDVADLKTWQSEVPLTLIPGEENGQSDHILELGVHTVTATDAIDYGARIAALQEGGGFIAGCHPQEYEDGEENIRNHAEQLDAFEIHNGLRAARGRDETRNIRLWDEILSTGTRIWGVASDDFHCEYISPGHGWVCVQLPEDESPVTWPKLISQLKAGAFYASTYSVFEYINLDENVLIVGADRFVQEIRVIGPEGTLLFTSDGAKLRWQVVPDLTYFRIEAVCGERRAWSQPFFAE